MRGVRDDRRCWASRDGRGQSDSDRRAAVDAAVRGGLVAVRWKGPIRLRKTQAGGRRRRSRHTNAMMRRIAQEPILVYAAVACAPVLCRVGAVTPVVAQLSVRAFVRPRLDLWPRLSHP